MMREQKIWLWTCDRCRGEVETRSPYSECPKGWKEQPRPDSANLMYHYCPRCWKERESDKPIIDHRQHRFFQAAMQRPEDFNNLSPQRQWEIDKSLGCLDWDGSCGHAVEGQKSLNRVLCGDCQKRFNNKFYRAVAALSKRRKKRARV